MTQRTVSSDTLGEVGRGREDRASHGSAVLLLFEQALVRFPFAPGPAVCASSAVPGTWWPRRRRDRRADSAGLCGSGRAPGRACGAVAWPLQSPAYPWRPLDAIACSTASVPELHGRACVRPSGQPRRILTGRPPGHQARAYFSSASRPRHLRPPNP